MASTPEAGGAAHVSARMRAAYWALLVLAILLVVFLRSPEVILRPSLEAEDGTFVFPYYYAERGAAGIIRFQAGYIPLVLNLFAFLSVRLPTRAIPYGFALLPLALAVVSYVWLFGEPFRRWLGSDATRAFVCLLFVLAPVAQYHIYANVTYSIWNASLLLVLLVVTPPSPLAWRNVAAWVVTNVLVWSNPLTLLVAPLVAVRLVRERGTRALHALTIANIALYNVVGVEKGGIFLGLTWIESLAKLVKAVGWTFAIVAGTAFRTVFGAPLYGWAEAGFWPPIAVWGVLVAAVTVVAARRSPRLRPLFAVLGYVIFAATFVSVLGRGPSTLVPINGAPRYVYLPTLAFVVLFVLLVEHFVVAERARRRAVAFGAVAVLYLGLNAQLGHYFVATGSAARPPGGPTSPYVPSDARNGWIVRGFFADLARIEAENGSRQNIRLTADKPGDWPIIADTQGGAPKR